MVEIRPPILKADRMETVDSRHHLDHQMRCTLARLELVSAISAVSYGSSHGTDDDPGGRKPPGDLGYSVYARRYGLPFHEPTTKHPGCLTNAEREDVLADAQEELGLLQHGKPADPEKIETHDATRARMLEETAGWALQDIARSHWRTSTTIMRRLRIADGRDAETGLVIEETNEPGLDLASRARTMKQAGMSIRGIGMVLGVKHPTQVVRLLKKVA